MPNIQQTVVSNLPKQYPNKSETKTNEPTSATKGTTKAKMNVPNKALRKKDCCRDTKSPAQKNFRNFLSEKQRKAQEEEEVTTKDS